MPAIRGEDSKRKARRYAARRDIDQIHEDLKSARHLQKHLETKAPEDLPGFGLYYCVECAKHFSDETNYGRHTKGKPHKRRVRQLKEEPYTQKEAEAAAGLTTDNGQRAKDEEMVEVAEVEVVDEVK